MPAEDAVEEDVRISDVNAGNVPSSEDRWPRGDTLKLVSHNVAGLEEEIGDPAVRMEAIVKGVRSKPFLAGFLIVRFVR